MKTTGKRLLISALLLALVLPALCAGAETYGRYALVCGTGSLNIRSSPSTSGQWLGTVQKGEWVEVLQWAGDNWYYARTVGSGLTGYMHGNFLDFGANDTAVPLGTGYVQNPVATQFLNLRQ